MYQTATRCLIRIIQRINDWLLRQFRTVIGWLIRMFQRISDWLLRQFRIITGWLLCQYQEVSRWLRIQYKNHLRFILLRVKIEFYQGSLLTETKRHPNYPQLSLSQKFNEFRARKLEYLLSSKWQCFLIYLSVVIVICFILSQINISFLNVIQNPNEITKYLLNNRITQSITLLSILFAVIGIAFSNIARKNSFSYSVLIHKARIYPLIYLMASLLISMILISLWSTFISKYLDIDRVALALSYFQIVVIAFITYSFIQILKFVDEDELYRYISDWVKAYYVRRHMEIQLEVISKDIYKQCLEKNGAINNIYCLSYEKYSNLTFEDMISTSNKKLIRCKFDLIDVNTERVEVVIKHIASQSGEKIYYGAVSICNDNEDKLIVKIPKDNIHIDQYVRLLRRCYTLKVRKSVPRQNAEEFIIQDLEERARQGDLRRVNQILDLMINLYQANSDRR